jgi:hypothetical protein
MAESGHRGAIVIALIGVAGTLGAAVISNWDKLFAPASRSGPASETRPAGDARPARESSPADEARPASESRSPARSEPAPSVEPARRAESRASKPLPAPAHVPSITGTWRDSDNPGSGSQVTVEGNGFRFTRWGVLPNGVRFEAQGSGTLTGQRFTSTYRARYQSGDSSTGSCAGTVSADGQRMEMSCRDSLLGTFPVTALRQ